MSGVNKVIILGNLGRDPDTRYLQSGNAVTNFAVATSEQWKDKTTGQKQEKTEWHNCTAFGRTAEIAGEYLRKGSKVYLEGRLQTDKYEKDGIERYSTKIIVSSLQLLDAKGSQEARQEAPQARPVESDGFDDSADIPF